MSETNWQMRALGYVNGRQESNLQMIGRALDDLTKQRAALHRISLGAQNSGTTKEGLGREARAALPKERP